jgi:hypothetical protein
MIGHEEEVIDVVAFNRKKKMHGYPSKWSPEEILNHYLRLSLSPLDYS